MYLQDPAFGGMSGVLLLGTVLENNDAQNKGTLKIRLYHEGVSKNILAGVRVLSSYAGEGYGSYLLPEIGEQVLVGFIGGCFDCPVVLGSLYTPSDAMLSHSYHKTNAVKRLKTKAGTVLEFNDDVNGETILLQTPEHLCISLKEQNQTIVLSAGKNRLILDGKNGKITVEAQQEILLKAGKAEFSLQAGGRASLKGSKVELSGSSIQAQSGGAVTLKGQRASVQGTMVEVKSSGVLTVKGSITKIN